jgi:hypothetical protein
MSWKNCHYGNRDCVRIHSKNQWMLGHREGNLKKCNSSLESKMLIFILKTGWIDVYVHIHMHGSLSAPLEVVSYNVCLLWKCAQSGKMFVSLNGMKRARLTIISIRSSLTVPIIACKRNTWGQFIQQIYFKNVPSAHFILNNSVSFKYTNIVATLKTYLYEKKFTKRYHYSMCVVSAMLLELVVTLSQQTAFELTHTM